MQRFSQQTAAEHATMREMAEQTGGRAFYNTNGLAQAVASAINDGSNFYTITYSPADTRFDGGFRKVDLKLQGPQAAQGLSLAYRHGYYAIDPAAAPRRRLPAPSGASAEPSPQPSPELHAAMLRGAPPATDLIFKASVLPTTPAGAPPEPSVAPGNQPNPKLARAPFRTYAVNFAAFPSQILTRNSTGNYTGSIRFITIAYDVEGVAVNLIDQTTAVNIAPDVYQRSTHGGLLFQQLISVPAKGEFFLRVGIEDPIHDHAGSLEVPVTAIKNLPPIASPAPPSPASGLPHP